MIDHRQWHLWYDILENEKFDVKKLTEKSEGVYYYNKFDPFKWLVKRGLAPPLVFIEANKVIFFENESPTLKIFNNYIIIITNNSDKIIVL